MKKPETKLLTVHEVAERIGAGRSTVRLWASKGKFAGAERVETPAGAYWLIPESSLEGFVNPGRGRPTKAGSKQDGSGAKKRDRQI